MVTWIPLAIVGLGWLGFFLTVTGVATDLWDTLPWSSYQKAKKAEAKRRDDAAWDRFIYGHKVPSAPRPSPREEEVDW